MRQHTHTEIEQWLPVPDYEGLYEVSDHGRVRSVDRVIETKKGPQRWRGKILKPAVKPAGYLFVALTGKSRHYVHHLVLEAFVGPRPEGKYGRHLDDDPENNSLENLKWGTPSENSYDKVRNGSDHYARRTRCVNGHEFTPENIERNPKYPGTRYCKKCRKINGLKTKEARAEYKRQWRAKRRAEGKPVT